jgi:MAF protein
VPKPSLVLASTSPFRRELLERLHIPFETTSPKTDETRQANESAEDLVKRLAEAKASAVAEDHPNSLIIGSDQVAVLGEDILGKPGNHENAIKQLKAASGKQVNFYTGLCLLNSANHNSQVEVVTFSVTFRELTDEQIEAYLRKEQPYNCAGSFKSEGLGIALFQRLEGDDPNALIGLPLIRLIDMLQREGVEVLAS